jgi:hypothetical protein
MPMEVAWADAEQTILNVLIHGPITWDQYHEACQAAYTMMESVSHRVDIVYIAQVDVPPGNPLPHFKKTCMRLQSSDNLGYCISVVPINIPLARIFTNLIYRAYGISNKFQTVYSLEEAHQMINASRARTQQLTSS